MKTKGQLIGDAALAISALSDEIAMIGALTPEDERELDLKLGGIDETIYELRTALRHLDNDATGVSS